MNTIGVLIPWRQETAGYRRQLAGCEKHEIRTPLNLGLRWAPRGKKEKWKKERASSNAGSRGLRGNRFLTMPVGPSERGQRDEEKWGYPQGASSSPASWGYPPSYSPPSQKGWDHKGWSSPSKGWNQKGGQSGVYDAWGLLGRRYQ